MMNPDGTLHVGINGRAFSVEEPGGAVQKSILLTNGLTSNSGIATTVYGHENATDVVSFTNYDSRFYASDSQLYGIIWETILAPTFTLSDIDVFFCPNSNPPLINAGVPTVVVFDDLAPERGWSKGYQKLYREHVVKNSLRTVDAYITVSEFSKSELCELYDVNPGDVHVVHNGIDSTFLSDSKGEEIDLPEDYVLFTGAMNPRKNITRVIDSFVKFKQESALPHELVLVGPSNKSTFKNFDANVDSRSDIHVTGFLSKPKLKYVYSEASAFVYPSLYEGFGLPPVEAMASGTPVVVSKTTSIPEVVGEAGIFVDPNDTDSIVDGLYRVLSDEQKRRELINSGKKRAEKYTWQSAVEKTKDILEDVAQQR